ncbi:MAG: hypothetical protein KF901_28150 [Myxococcales bacterium]|nr:hypothetical protein [Myxococcales bacterium]
MATAKNNPKKKVTKKRSPGTGRGSPEAVEKRRVARALNSLILGGGSADQPRLDGRTEKRRQRLVEELRDGRRGKPLKPIDVVIHTNELLEIGETLASLKRQGIKPTRITLDATLQATIERAHKAYGFRNDAWKMLGLSVDAEGKATVLTGRGGPRKAAAPAPKKAAKPRKASKKKG